MISPFPNGAAPRTEGTGTCPYTQATGSGIPGRHDSRGFSSSVDSLYSFGLLDLFDDGFVRDPYPWLDVLRAEAPVYHDPVTGLWLVSRYQDVHRVLLDPDAFRPDNAQDALTPLELPALRVLARAGFRLRPALANNGTTSHAGLRRVVTRFFGARQVAAAVPVIDRIAEELLGQARVRMDADGSCDLFEPFARLLPCRVMMELLGIDDLDAATLALWSDASLELFWGRPSAERQVELAALVGEFHQWLTAMLSSGTAPADSFAGTLVRHRLPDGRPLDLETAVGACFFVFVAGQSTTGQLISTVLRRALGEPGLWPRPAREEGLAQAWVEEVLRREPPVTTWRRITARPVELGGVALPANAELLLMLMGSGSDPQIFTDPARTHPHRTNARRHLAFGAGSHRCPGASLARTEAAVALRAAARCLPDVRLAAETSRPPMLGLLSFRAPLRVTVVGRAA